jgi:hypothetical protein
MRKITMKEEAIARELANHLAFMGLKKADCQIGEDEFGERSCLVAKWKIGPGANVDVCCYFGTYFGAPHIWIGFESPDAQKIALIMRGINKDAFASIHYTDWNEDFGLVNTRKMEEIERKGFTCYENYGARSRYWAWFGRYFAAGSDVTKQVMPFLRLVVRLRRSRQPLGVRTHVGPTEAPQLKKARIGQDKFRQAVIEAWDGKCAVTGCEIVPALEAAHIRQWSAKGMPALRTSPENGLLLSRTLHSLFDLGMISFSNTGRMKISRYVDSDERERLNIKEGMKLKKRLSDTQKLHMAVHREQSLVDT